MLPSLHGDDEHFKDERYTRGARMGASSVRGRDRRFCGCREGTVMMRPLLLLVGSNVSANLADGFWGLAVPLLAIRLTDDPLVISLATAASLLPSVLFSVPVGALVDRMDRARTLMLVNLVRGAVLLVLSIGVAGEAVGIPLLYGTVVLVGVLELISDNTASSLVPTVAGREHLDRANGWVQGGQLVAQSFVAVPLAAVLFALFAWGPFAVASCAYALAAAAAVALRMVNRRSVSRDVAGGSVEPGAGRFDWLKSIKEGWLFVRGHDVLGRLIGMGAVLAGVVALANAIMVVYLVDELRVPFSLVGVLCMGLALGGLLGIRVSVPLSARRGRCAAAQIGFSAILVGSLVAFLAPEGVTAAVALFTMSLGAATWNVVVVSARQALTPDELLGRVLGLASLVLGIAQVLGAVCGGLLARIGLRVPFLVGAVVILALVPVLRCTPFEAARTATPGADLGTGCGNVEGSRDLGD